MNMRRGMMGVNSLTYHNNLYKGDEWQFSFADLIMHIRSSKGKAVPDEKTEPPYEPVLPYAQMAITIRERIDVMPECMRDAWDELAQTLEYAAANVSDFRSDYSHYSASQVALDYVMNSTPDNLFDDRLTFCGLLVKQFIDAYEVMEWGEPREKYPSLQETEYPSLEEFRARPAAPPIFKFKPG